ncbi:MAG TPA: SURF1 family protein [Woeseiaceae bacterium]|nr:SURF1 family protein [Woeseiaceae bacterium]
MTTKTKKPLPSWLPLVIGFILVVQFAGLGAWQISRGMEKRATQNLFRDESGFTQWRHGVDVRPYQRIKVSGRFDPARQFILENIIISSRYGYYIITPLEVSPDAPLLLVNRGWIEKGADTLDLSALDLPLEPMTVRGRAGSLPRAGYKMGTAINPTPDWPKYAVYPSLEEVSEALGRDVQAFVLLLDHEEQLGFYRHWVPTEFGPGKHFAYALQWFAMGAVLSGLLIWNYRKKRFDA